MTFYQRLASGQVGESRIAVWFQKKGYSVLPVYEIETNTGKGPRLFTPTCKVIAPDMLVFKSNKALWIEAKHKTAFSWHRQTGRFVTGIDLRHYTDYLKIKEFSVWETWLLFLHDGGQAKDSPPSPSGLFGNKLERLAETENHRSHLWGNSGMVYWSIHNLIKLANIDEL